MFSKSSQILITGGAGFLGGHIVNLLHQKGYHNLFIPRSKDFDLREKKICRQLTQEAEIVIHLAANVGGIGYNRNFPAELFYDNLIMGINLLHESFLSGVKKFLALGTVCAYPKYTPVPFKEEYLWNGYPEETNAPYGLAKKMLLVGSQAYRKQYGFHSIYLLPVNLYGPHDNFKLHQSHVIPSLIKKIYMAKIKSQEDVTVWGTGTPTREFLYVEDAAEAIILAMERYDKEEPINIGYGKEITIVALAKKISKILKFHGKIKWDKTKPDGQPRRLLNTQKAYQEFGFRAKTSLDDGLNKTIEWFLQQHAKDNDSKKD